MKQQSRSHNAARKIDSICDRFEAAWNANQRPSIETFLTDVEPDQRRELLRELLLIECEMLERAGVDVSPQTYLDRFPESTTAILDAWQEYTGAREQPPSLLGHNLTIASPGIAPAAGSVVLQSGETIGDYLIIEELGRGGMGVVYRARQRSAGREVALKVISAERLQGHAHQRHELIQRFRTEAQAAARLDHPNIVTVFEVGEVAGRHFFSMRYVRGRSLADILADGPLDCRLAARYMEAAARAVHAAHQHAILHRDLNPRNILIDQATDEPLVADFGLAKMLDAEQNETMAGAVFGSPPYMPPEQVSEASQVREAADVYSLGATFYHMLTGRPPFLAASVTATMYQVLNELPLRPRELDSSIDRDLETICLKCLRKEPGQRYASAGELADDLERYINFEPIKARPLGPIGIFWRWCLRNQMMASVITIAVTLLTISALFSADAYIKASHALASEAKERQLAAQRRDEAMIYLQMISSAVGEMVDHVSKDPRLREQGLEELRRTQLEVASRVYDRLLDYHPDDPELLAAQAEAFHQRGQILKLLGQSAAAESAFQSAVEILAPLTANHPDNVLWSRQLAKMHAELGMLYLPERLADARAALARSQDIRRRLSERRPDDQAVQRDLAVGQTQRGQLFESELKLEQALELYERARGDFARLAEAESPDPQITTLLAESWLHLGRVHNALGKLSRAEPAYRSGLEILERLRAPGKADPELLETLATGQNNLADVLIRSDRPEQASEAFQAAAGVFQELVRSHPNVGSYLHKLAICDNNLASLRQQQGDLETAEAHQRQAIDAMQSLVKQYPADIEYQKDLALSRLNLGILLGDAGRLAEAEVELAETQLLFERLCAKYPRVARLKQELAKCLASRGKLALAENALEQAESLLAEAAEAQTALVGEFPHLPEYHRDLAETFDSLAVAAVYQDQLDLAEARLEKATGIYVDLAERYPDSFEIRRDLARCHLRQGVLLADGDRAADAIAAMEQAIVLLEAMSRAEPENTTFVQELADACFQRGTLGDDEGCEPRLRQALELWSQLHKLDPSPLYLMRQSRAISVLAQNRAQRRQWEDALHWRVEAVAVAERIDQIRSDDAFAGQLVALALAHRAETLIHLERFDEAAQDWRAALRRSTSEQRPTLYIDWARALCEAGQHALSARVLADAREEKTPGRALLVDAARVCLLAAVVATKDERLEESQRDQARTEYLNQALDWLRQGLQTPETSTAAELAAIASLKKAVAADEAFAPLRARPGWAALFPADSANPP